MYIYVICYFWVENIKNNTTFSYDLPKTHYPVQPNIKRFIFLIIVINIFSNS